MGVLGKSSFEQFIIAISFTVPCRLFLYTMGGGYQYPSEIEEGEEEMLSLPEVFGTGISVCKGKTENSPVSPKNQKEMSTAPKIFSSEDTI